MAATRIVELVLRVPSRLMSRMGTFLRPKAHNYRRETVIGRPGTVNIPGFRSPPDPLLLGHFCDDGFFGGMLGLARDGLKEGEEGEEEDKAREDGKKEGGGGGDAKYHNGNEASLQP